MLSVEKCKKVLEEDGVKTSEEEIKTIRKLLYEFAYIGYEQYKLNNRKRRK